MNKTLGNGCGVNGGGPTLFANGGQPQRGIKQGVDGTLLPKSKPTVWQLGSTVDVAWALSANHGAFALPAVGQRSPGPRAAHCGEARSSHPCPCHHGWEPSPRRRGGAAGFPVCWVLVRIGMLWAHVH